MSREQQLNNKRLAQNTAFLYIRMLLIMVIQFFTVRITLEYLGFEDYGIYNVVCGVTNVFVFFTHTMTSASQRFLAYDLGKDDIVGLKKTFDTLVSLFTLCGLIGVAIVGLGGYWFINTQLVIPIGRMDAALFAFYFMLLTLFVSVVVLPFNSLIIAHEDMKTFAYVSVIDAVLKLFTVYCLIIIPFDKLKLYAVLTFIASLTPSSLYVLYCCKKYKEVTWKRNVKWSMAGKIVPFMSWNLLGGLSWMLCTQGLSIVINLYFGPIANAAKAIADKVNGSINGFANNFMMAAQPQIVKTYANGDFQGMHKVIFLTSNISFFLMMTLTMPVIVNADNLLDLWLVEHDWLTTIMVQLVLLFSLIGALETPINQAIRATGNIKKYQIYIGFITALVIPVAYIFFKMNMPAYFCYVALILVYGAAYFARLYFLKKQVHVTYRTYFNIVLKRCLVCFFLNIVFLVLFFILFSNVIIYPIFGWIVSVCISLGVIYVFGLTKDEKLLFYIYVQKIIANKK